MTRVLFETAALADAIRKAERVAPGSAGQAFDKAAGILLEIAPETPTPAVVKATNLDIYSMEWLDILEGSGDATVWRLPSRLFAQVIASLPIGSGKGVELIEHSEGHHKQVHLKAGRTTARFNLLDEHYYPRWSAFDPALLAPVTDVGGRIAQVEWAVHKSEVPFCGVHFDGKYCIATDKIRVARTDLIIPHADKPFTVPAGVLSSLLKQSGEVQVGFSGGQLLMMPDEHSQIRAIIFGHEFPSLTKAFDREIPDSFTSRKQPLLDIMTRATNFAGSERNPLLKCFIGKQEFAVMMSNDETGLLGDVIELPGQVDHDRCSILFTPKNIMDPIEKSPSDEVVVHYNKENSRSPVRVDGGSGFSAWVMPRAEVPVGSSNG